jgi:hypothetical protein
MVRTLLTASALTTALAMPSCNQIDGDYPGCGISKMTHAASQPISGKKFMYKYFNVQTPGDECTNDLCDCSSEGAPNIEQGRVYTTREISPSGGGAPPGNGFGLHLVSVPGHKTTGGVTVEEVEAHFNEKLGDMSKFDSFMDFNVVFATSSLQSYKSAFEKDGVKHLVGTWSDNGGKAYSSIIVQVPDSQLILELVQQTSLTLADGESAVQLEQRVPDSVLSQQESRLSGEAVTDTTSDYIVSLVVNRAASSKAMAKLESFYVDGMGTSKTHDVDENGASKKCFLWPGASVNVCFTARDDSETSTSFKVGDFEDMLNNVHKTIVEGHPECPMDRWFDNHYAIDSQSVSSSKILAYINSQKPFHTCGSNPMRGAGLSAVWDPTGLGIQMDTGTGLPSDCSSVEESFLKDAGTYNPACTVDTSKCGSLSADVTV